MPAVSKSQQKLMGIVHAIQKGEADPKDFSKDAQKMAKDMKPSDVKDFASTKQKGLPDKKTESIAKLKEYIRKMVKEMTGTDAVGGYATPFAFGKPGNEKKKAKKQADLTGYSVVKEENETAKRIQNLNKRIGDLKSKISKAKYPSEKDKLQKTLKNALQSLSNVRKSIGVKPVQREHSELSENRWLELKREDSSPNSKIGKGLSNINRQLAEMEKFLNWYGRLKQENGVSNNQFWKSTNRNIYSIKERLMKLEQKIRKISE